MKIEKFKNLIFVARCLRWLVIVLFIMPLTFLDFGKDNHFYFMMMGVGILYWIIDFYIIQQWIMNALEEYENQVITTRIAPAIKKKVIEELELLKKEIGRY